MKFTRNITPDIIEALQAGRTVRLAIGDDDLDLFPVPAKKKKVTRWLWVRQDYDGDWRISISFKTEEEAKKDLGGLEHKRLDWSATEFEE